MTDAATATGRKVLAALEQGRRRHAIEEAARVRELGRLIAYHANEDAARGNGERGRAVRIARQLHGLVARRTVAKYLARLSERANLIGDDSVHPTNEADR